MPSVTQSITCQLWHPFSNRLTVLFRSCLHQTQPLKQWTVIQTVTGPWTYFFFFCAYLIQKLCWHINYQLHEREALLNELSVPNTKWWKMHCNTKDCRILSCLLKAAHFSITLLSFISVSLLVFFFSNFAVKVLRLWPPPTRHVVSALFCKTTDNLKQHYATLLPKTNLKASNPL